MTRLYKVTYEICGCVDACLVRASSKYSAKQRFYALYPSADIIRVEEANEYNNEE